MAQDWILAIDFTHENVTAAFVSPDGMEEGSAGFDLCDFMAGESRPLEKLTSLLAAKLRVAPGKPVGAVLTLPCDMDAARQKVISFPQASWLDNQPLPEIIARALELPVLMERQAIARLAYDRAMLCLPDNALVIGCYVDTHYEGAIWCCGAPLTGRNGMAGNIAHMAIHDREDRCFCGKAGCVDLYGAGVRLRQMHTMIFPDTPAEELFVRHGEHPIMRDYIAMMAYPIAIEINILDPDYAVLGGTVPAMRGFPRLLLEENIRRLAYSPAAERDIAFLPSPASEATGTLCAAQYAAGRLADAGA